VLLIENGTLLSHDGARLTETTGWLAVRGDRIAALGAGAAPDEWQQQAGRRINARHMVVLPGLVNGHTHLSQTFLRGLAEDRPLLRWLKEVIWPAQAAMTPEDQYLAALLGLVENLRCGVTTVVQHHKLPGRAHVDAACRAAAQVGVRMVLARGWVDLGSSGEPLDHILAEMAWLHATWDDPTPSAPPSLAGKGEGGKGRIRIASGPLAPWRCSDDALRQITALARSWGAATHIHVAETQDEIALLFDRCGRRHIEWLADLGCLGPDTQLVHAVHVTDAELDLIAQAGATVVYCPTSNLYLASGAAPVRKMLDRGIDVAIGADGSASNTSQDLLECAKMGTLLAKHANEDAQALVAADAIRMMTVSGARLWGAPAAGELRAGAPADIVLVDLNNVRCQPVHNAAAALVYNANGADAHTVIVGGDILLDAGRVTMLDEAALLEDCRQAAAGLMKRADVGTLKRSNV